MKVRVTVGDVDVRVDDLDMSLPQLRGLIRLVGSLALAVGGEPEVVVGQAPIGFTAHIERAPDVVEDLSEWFEDEE